MEEGGAGFQQKSPTPQPFVAPKATSGRSPSALFQ